ncbi:MAG: DNA polymerase IV, partial [Clostridia bacterium]|nr:DNA polymerase IV [Clostridia bacterium]
MKHKIILHCDVNNFFASVECALNPSIKDLPVAVTGEKTKRNGIVLAKNNIAKSFGV